MNKYTFEWTKEGECGWSRSIKREDTIEKAATEMAKFAVCCHENDYRILVRIVTVKESKTNAEQA